MGMSLVMVLMYLKMVAWRAHRRATLKRELTHRVRVLGLRQGKILAVVQLCVRTASVLCLKQPLVITLT